MIVAITGANGFIGQHLVRRFADAGWTIRAVVRRDFGALSTKFGGADVVVHAAGATRAPTAAELGQANAGLTALTVREAARAGVTRFVFVSSQAAAGPALALDAPIAEDAPAAPVEAYGRSKLRAEEIVRASGLESVIVRPVATYGPADRDFLELFRFARRGLAIHPANRDHWFSIVHVRDLANAIVRAACSPAASGNTYFLGSDVPVQWHELYRQAAAIAGKRIAIDAEVPVTLVRLAGRVGDVAARVTGRASLLTSEKIALSRPKFWICSSARARRDLGFETAVDLQSGLRETYHWYRTAGWL